MASGDDSYKLPLRQWLVKQIESRKYTELEWEGPDKKYFRLPWEKKHGVDWKEKHKLFEAWAIHRKGNAYTTQDPSKLKANFRSALNKSESFDEVPLKNQLQNQSGNYKVYRILSPQEVEEKKRNLKRKKENSGQVNVASSNFNSLEIQPKKERVASPMNQYQNHNGYNNYNGVETENQNGVAKVQSDFTNNTYVEMSPFSTNNNWLDEDNDMLLKNQFTLAGPSPVMDTTSWQDQSLDIKMDASQQLGAVGFTPDHPLLLPQTSNNNNLTTINASAIQQSGDIGQLDSKDLESFASVLPYFDIAIYYDGVLQIEHQRILLSQGLRMHYGAKRDSRTGAVIKQYHPSMVSSSESCFGLNLPDIEFPRRPTDNTYMTQILEGLRLGFKIQYENNFKLSVTRFCQTHIFIASSQEPLKKIERQTPTTAFGVDEYLKKWNNNNNNNTSCLWLACGIKPKKVSFEADKGVWVKVKPCISDFCTGEQMQSMQQSVCMSNMIELEEILKSISISNSEQTPSSSK